MPLFPGYIFACAAGKCDMHAVWVWIRISAGHSLWPSNGAMQVCERDRRTTMWSLFSQFKQRRKEWRRCDVRFSFGASRPAHSDMFGGERPLCFHNGAWHSMANNCSWRHFSPCKLSLYVYIWLFWKFFSFFHQLNWLHLAGRAGGEVVIFD